MLDQIVGPLVPVAFVIALGFVAGKRGTLSYSDSLLISRLVLNWIFPALLLAGMASTPRSQLLDFRFVVATFVGLMGMYVVAFAISWYQYRQLKEAALKGLVCGYPDAAFMGIPILQTMFGPGSLYSVLVLNVIASLIMMPLTTTLLTIASGEGSGAKAFISSILEAVRRPLMWAPAIGILCSALAIKLPPVLADSLNLLGKATPGVSLLCLGLIMASVQLKLSHEVWENMAFKLFVQPALMIGAAVLLSISGIYAQQMILLCALPSATISGMFANEAGAYRDEAATSILVSTILSVLTVPLAI
jgi:malonate transporter and related proteins